MLATVAALGLIPVFYVATRKAFELIGTVPGRVERRLATTP